MSAVRPLSALAGLAFAALASLLGWLLVFPLALLVPKRRDWVAVIGRQHGRFLDNAKYFFLQATAEHPSLRWVFVTEWNADAALIAAHGHAVLRYPGLRAAWFMLRCGVVVVDESSWFRHGRRFLLARARVAQLWHGVGCKRIELDLWRHEARASTWTSNTIGVWLRLALYRITGRWLRYDILACTSAFYRDEVFRPAFRARRFVVSGYPRNDFARALTGASRALAWANVDANLASNLPIWQRAGRRVVVVAPTFRDSGAAPMQMDAAMLKRMDDFAEAHALEFVFKFHPAERNASGIAGRHLQVCASDSDIYPVLPYAAALVTDYSSIATDFALLDKPLLFLIPEGDDYMQRERQLQFDPRSLMPGPIVSDWPAMLAALLAEWEHDGHAGARAALRRKAFDDLPQARAVPTLLACMREQGWIAPTQPKPI